MKLSTKPGVTNISIPRQWPVLYHGTAAASVPYMIREGIAPRRSTGKSNFHNIPSNEQTVYLTDAYAHFFAYNAAANSTNDGQGFAVLEIDTSKLEAKHFVADEDFLEQHNRITGAVKVTGNLASRTAYFRERAHLYDPWISLLGLGTIGYRSAIPWRAVKRVCFVPENIMHGIILEFDPFISIENYAVMGGRYRLFMRSLFDEIGPHDPAAPMLEKLLAAGFHCTVQSFMRRQGFPQSLIKIEDAKALALSAEDPPRNRGQIKR